jgi:hypothetical protein
MRFAVGDSKLWSYISEHGFGKKGTTATQDILTALKFQF